MVENTSMTVKDSEERVTIAEIRFVDGCIFHVLTPSLHISLAEGETVSTPLSNVLVCYWLRDWAHCLKTSTKLYLLKKL